jgi:hypothetical protein
MSFWAILINTPSIWVPFMIVGPACLYIGLSLHGWRFIQSQPIPSLLTLIGVGQFLLENRWVVVAGTMAFSIGLFWLALIKGAKK